MKSLPTRLVVHRAKAVDSRGERPNSWLAIDGGVIAATGRGNEWRSRPGIEVTEVLDAKGRKVIPGFIDLHSHGGGGASFETHASAIATGIATHRAHGTTRSIVSLVTSPLDRIERSLSEIRDLMAIDRSILGAHLEGPFLSPLRKGAQAEQYLRLPTLEDVGYLISIGRGVVRQITIAPELPGALEAITRFTDEGIIVALGHSEADEETTMMAIDRGATLVTHLYNAMGKIHHRTPGLAVVALQDPRVTLELIGDATHVNPRMVKMTFDLAPGRVALVTDAMAAAGAKDGEYFLGGQRVTVSEGRAILPGSNVLSGSTLTQDRELRNTVAAGVPLIAAVEALTRTPARALGLPDVVGDLVVGHDAGVLMLDDDLAVTRIA